MGERCLLCNSVVTLLRGSIHSIQGRGQSRSFRQGVAVESTSMDCIYLCGLSPNPPVPSSLMLPNHGAIINSCIRFFPSRNAYEIMHWSVTCQGLDKSGSSCSLHMRALGSELTHPSMLYLICASYQSLLSLEGLTSEGDLFAFS